MAVKVKELAEILGLSPATVSMALNNRPGISSQTREKVVQLAEEMGFKDRDSLPVNRGNIQLIIFKRHAKVISDTPFFSLLMEGMDEQCTAMGYMLAIKYMSGIRFDAEEANACIAQNSAKAAILLATEMNSDDMEEAMQLNVPFISADSYFIDKKIDCVTINNTQGAYVATKHLIEKGHQNIGHLSSAVVINNFTERTYGYTTALKDHGISVQERFTFEVESTMDGAHDDMARILQANPDMPTAFFADNDIIALGAIKAMKEFGYKIPQDISVVGFDDMPYCTMMDPPLTTINVDKKNLGKITVKMLLDKMQSRSRYFLKTELAVNLIERDSVVSLSAPANTAAKPGNKPR